MEPQDCETASKATRLLCDAGKGTNKRVSESTDSGGNVAKVARAGVDSPSKGGGETVKLSGPRDTRNLFTSLMDYHSLSCEEQTAKGDNSVNDSVRSSSNSKNNSSVTQVSRGGPESEAGSRDSDHPSPAKRSRTQSPKANPSKFNGETPSPRDSHGDKKFESEKDFFKVPTPKSNSVEEKDFEDTENLVVRRKSRTSTTRPVLSPASPVSSPENLIIDCQTVSPRTLQNKTNSPQCNPDLLVTENLRMNSNLKMSKTHAPSPKIKASPVNSPVTMVTKDHSNPGSVSNSSPCDIDDDLMNEAIMGFNS